MSSFFAFERGVSELLRKNYVKKNPGTTLQEYSRIGGVNAVFSVTIASLLALPIEVFRLHYNRALLEHDYATKWRLVPVLKRVWEGSRRSGVGGLWLHLGAFLGGNSLYYYLLMKDNDVRRVKYLYSKLK